MKIFITGATGFLGTALSRRLTQDGHEVIGIGSCDADLCQQGSLIKYKTHFDQIYHLAAWTQAGDFCLTHPGEQWVRNQHINSNVLDWWQKMQPQAKMITIGTSCSYSPDFQLKEEHYLDGSPIESLFTYAHTKRMLLVGQKAMQRQYGMRWMTYIPSTLYGPGYHTDGRQMHFIFDLIRKILRGKLFSCDVCLWGDGYQKRELVYVNDFVECVVRLSGRMENELINIGNGEEFTIRYFASEICKQVGYDPGCIKYDERRYVGALSKCLSIDRLKTVMPEYKTTPLDTGLSQTIKWFFENRERVLDV